MPLNPLGVPETEADWQFVVETVARRSPVPPVGADLERVHVAFLKGLAKEMQLMEATGRWLFSRPPNRQPREHVPGDVLGLRAKTVVDYVICTPDQKGPAIRFDAVALGALLATAQPYWLPAAGVGAVLTSEPPPDLNELRLPYPAATVWFAQPIQPGGAMRPESFDSIGWLWGGPTDPEFAHDSAYLAARADNALVLADAAIERARIDGVLLLAEDDGQPIDLVAWVLSTPQPGLPTPKRTPIPARPSCAGWRGALDLLAAIVAWGDWHPPAEPIELSPEPTRAEMRQLRFGRTRRLEEAGALARVLVLDTRRERQRSRHREAKPDPTHLRPPTCAAHTGSATVTAHRTTGITSATGFRRCSSTRKGQERLGRVSIGCPASVRPPVSVTEPIKREQLAAYALQGQPLSTVELDHLIPLELGGAPQDVANLWVEPWNGNANAHMKDAVETYLNREVCRGAMPLADAQLPEQRAVPGVCCPG